jgi:dTDP-glucose 4,6-dehydratase
MAKGIILAGGTGSRLAPLTTRENKHMLPVYTKRMIEYPLETITDAGIGDIVLITGGQSPGSFLELLKNGKGRNIDRLYYTYQEGNGGIADALQMARPFITKEHFLADVKEPSLVVLGDNYFEDGVHKQWSQWMESTGGSGAGILLKHTDKPEDFGIAEIDPTTGRVVSIEEKPSQPKSNLAILGCYFFDEAVWDYVGQVKASARGEMEITDVLQFYLEQDKLTYYFYEGFWSDLGTFENWSAVSQRIAKREQEKYLAHHLTSIGKDFIGIDALFTGSNLDNTEGLDFRFFKLDLACEEQVKHLFKCFPIRQVVHLAAASHVDRSISGDAEFWRSNVVGTANLMRSCRDWQVDKVVNQITDEFYGEVPRTQHDALEGEAPDPTSPYPCSKVAQYYVGRSFYTTYGVPVVSTFPVNNFGPRQHVEKLIPKFITNLLAGKKVPLMASSHFERDWLPVKDMCRALDLLLEEGVGGQDYNVGADNHHTNLEITEKLLTLTDRDESFIETVPDRAAHDSRYAVDSAKIKELGYKPRYLFDDYLEQTVEWYKENTYED